VVKVDAIIFCNLVNLVGSYGRAGCARAGDRRAYASEEDRVGTTGSVSALHEFANEGVLVGAYRGLFLARAVNGEASVDPIGKIDTGGVLAMHDFPGGDVLVFAEKGWFLARWVNGEVVVYSLGKQPSGRIWNLPGDGGVLIEVPGGMLAVAKAQASRAACVAP
jgi:hypothetical protein